MFSCLQINCQPFYLRQLLKFHPFDWMIEIYLQTESQGTHHKMVTLQPMPGFSPLFSRVEHVEHPSEEKFFEHCTNCAILPRPLSRDHFCENLASLLFHSSAGERLQFLLFVHWNEVHTGEVSDIGNWIQFGTDWKDWKCKGLKLKWDRIWLWGKISQLDVEVKSDWMFIWLHIYHEITSKGVDSGWEVGKSQK